MAMACVDERLQASRTSIRRLRRIRVDTVVSPVASARELRDRHQFHRVDPKVAKIWKLFDRCRESAGSAERPDVQFVNHILIKRRALPSSIGPRECLWIDHSRRTVYAV